MKSKKAWKLGLSLIIALAFILPTNAMADNGGQEASVGLIANEMKNIEGTPEMTKTPLDSPLQDVIVCFNDDDINLLPAMPVDCYDVNITVHSEVLMLPMECEIKAFMDIFKEEELPKEEIICFDFEDTWDIYNYWDSVDDTTDSTSGPGGIDTWCRTDERSSSPSYSMRSTQFDDHYMGNQLDYLMAHIENTEDYAEIVVDFCSWVDGEIIDDGDGNDVLEDYGWCEYSFDGLAWTSFGEYYYDEPEWNCSKTHTIPGATGEADIYFRFAWTTGPTIQNEGWYVDDVCFYGQEESGMGNLVLTSHSLHQFVVPPGGEYTFEFPDTWCPDEGNYTIRIWLLSETPECEVCYPQADPFLFDITIGDVTDIAVTANCIVAPSVKPYDMGDDLIVEGTVENMGTMDAIDLPVTFSIKEQVEEVILNDYIESGVGDWSAYYFSSGITPSPWHITDFKSFSPDHSWTCMNETTKQFPAGMDNGLLTPDIVDWWENDPVYFDFECELLYEFGTLGPSFGFVPVVSVDGIHQFGGSLTDPGEGPYLDGSSSGWQHFSFSDYIINYDTYWEVNTNWGGYGDFDRGLIDFLEIRMDAHPEYDWSAIQFGFNLHTDTAGALPDFSGVFIDNAKIIKVYPGGEVYKEVIIIDELGAATPSEPAEFEDVEFIWEEIPTGNFIEEKFVPNDDNNDNNLMSEAFSVEVLWAEVDEADVEHYDLTEGLESHWHVTTSGYNNYLWCGEESTGTYGDEWNDILLFAPDGEPELDMSGLGTVFFELDEFCETDVGNDRCLIEINPHVEDPGYQWYVYDPPTYPVFYDDFEFPPGAPVGAWVDPLWVPTGFPATSWFQVPYGWGFDPVGTPVQYAVSDVWWWGPVDEGIMAGPFDLTTYPFNFIDYDTSFVTSPTSPIIALNAYSGLVPAFEEQLVDWTYLDVGYIWGAHPNFEIDASGYADPSNVWFEFYHQSAPTYGVECHAVDDFLVYGSALATPGSSNYGWQHSMYELTPDKFINPITSVDFATEIGAFTDEMGLRLRWTSDSEVHYRGLLVDNLHLHGSGDVFDLDECDDLDNFILDTLTTGDYWYYDIPYGGWICQDQIAGVLPNDLNNGLVWETTCPSALSADLHFTHEYDLEENDYCYLEFSTDGGDSWTAPIRYTGAGSGDVTVDMSSFTGANVLIRWRVTTNETGMSTVYKVKDMYIMAQIDENAPVTVGTLSGTIIHGWYSSAVTFTATATDDVSGVDATYYKIDGGSTITYSAPITIRVNGDHYIEYWSVDKVGNEEIHKTTPTFKIDTGSAPSVAISAPGDGLYLFGNQLLPLTGRTIIIGGFTVQATASDSDSGVYRVQFALDGTVFGEATASPYSAYCGAKHTGAGTITVTAEDFTGNTASATKDITYFKFL